MAKEIEVRSHVGRDLLQSAGVFKNERLAVWEYVSNSLQYVDVGVNPIVSVTINKSKKQIEINDNGRGMNLSGMKNFFIMHGENIDRKSGRGGRGRFGTGKAAAFGIANKLTVSSVVDGRRNTVQLSRNDIDAAGNAEIPVDHIVFNEPTDDDNGTCVTISDVKLRKLDPNAVISYIERHLRSWPGRPTVIVNSHECEFTEPPVAERRVCRPEGTVADQLGDVELVLKVSKGPMERDLQGVAISANGTLHQTTLAGAEGQPMANFIFGDIDVPALEDEDAPIPAFDMSRSMELNASNETVKALFAFVGREIDKLRRELVQREKSKREEEETKTLNREADLIAKMINEDFLDFSHRVARVKARTGRGRDSGSATAAANDDDDILTTGDQIPAVVDASDGDYGHGDGTGTGGSGDEPRKMNPALRSQPSGKVRGDSVGGAGQKKRPQGGFRVEFREMGEEFNRAVYSPDERAIFVNMDHPQIVAAKGLGNDHDPTFRRLAYEVAFSEYAIALANELAKRDEYIDPTDPIFDIREAMNRMARRTASLYSS